MNFKIFMFNFLYMIVSFFPKSLIHMCAISVYISYTSENGGDPDADTDFEHVLKAYSQKYGLK